MQGLVRLFATLASGASWSDGHAVDEMMLKESVRSLREAAWRAESATINLVALLKDEIEQHALLEHQMEEAQRAFNNTLAASSKSKAEGLFDEAAKGRANSRARMEQISTLQAEQDEVDAHITQLERLQIPHAKGMEFKAKEQLQIAKRNLNKVHAKNVVLRPKKPFPYYPEGISIPSMLHFPSHKFCPCYKTKGFVSRAAVIVSCGCAFHPSCIGAFLQVGELSCPCCISCFDGLWLVQFAMSLTAIYKREVEEMIHRIDNSDCSEFGYRSASSIFHFECICASTFWIS
jgi:hypothetical protein